jgi:hypothetical protein
MFRSLESRCQQFLLSSLSSQLSNFSCIAFVASLSLNYIFFDFSAVASSAPSTFSQMPTLLVSTEETPDYNLGRATEKRDRRISWFFSVR